MEKNKGQKENPAESEKTSDEKAAIKSPTTFAERVDAVLSGADMESSHLELLKVTPPLLRMVGVPNLPILMTARHVKTITQEKGSDSANYHGLGTEIIKKLPELISDPVMIMDSLTQNDSIVIVMQTVDKQNRPVIGAIKLNGIGRQKSEMISANILTSAYGRNNFQSFIERNVERGTVLYADKEKSQALSVNPGIQFPDVMASLSFNTIIRKTKAFVKSQEEKIEENKTSEKVENTEKKEEKMKLTDRIKHFFGRMKAEDKDVAPPILSNEEFAAQRELIDKDLNASQNPESFEFPPLEIEHKEKIIDTENMPHRAFAEDTIPQSEQSSSNSAERRATEFHDKVFGVREEMVKNLIGYIEQNPKKWEAGWNNIACTAPENGKTGTPYRGLNLLNLTFTAMQKGYTDPRWVTFNQAKELGVSIKKGEKASTIVFYELYDRTTKKSYNSNTTKSMTDEQKDAYMKKNVYAIIKYSNVFNAAQCHNFPERDIASMQMKEEERAKQNVLIESIISNSAAPILYDGGNEACYSPMQDKIHLPPIEAFNTMQDYYATALHEIAHSTGHKSRLNRDLNGFSYSPEFAKEELRAELACVFMQVEQGLQLDGKHFSNHAAYLNSWLSQVKNDPQVFYAAARDAEKISDYVAENYLHTTQSDEYKGAVREDFSRNTEAELTKTLLDDAGAYVGTLNDVAAEKAPLVINLFAGPSAGKTTAALELTAALKKEGYNVEYVSEFAKELVLEGRTEELKDQEFVTNEQYHRIDRLRNSGVEIIVTDSPVLLGKVYGEGKNSAEYDKQILDYHNSFENFNLMVKRGETFQAEGRVHNLEQSKELDAKITSMLRSNRIFYGNYHHGDIDKTIDRINATYARLYGEKQVEAQQEESAEKTVGEELMNKTTWSKINLPDGAVGNEYGKTTLVKMPQSGEYAHFGVFVPTQYLKQDSSGKWQLNVGDKFTYRLTNDGRQVELTGQELKDSFAGTFIGKTLERVAPSRKTLSVFDNLEKNVPAEMKAIPNWCVYRTWQKDEEKKGKVIKSAVTGEGIHKSDSGKYNANDFVDFNTALKYAKENGFVGLSFVLDGKAGITCIDLDKCIKNAETGEMKERAAKLIEELKGTYMERSTSGNGVHIFIKDDILKGGKYKDSSVSEEKGDLEVFDNQRIISMTGDMFSETNTLTRAGSSATVYLRQELGEKQQTHRSLSSDVRTGYKAGSDREVVERIRRSKRAGDFEDLYTGHGITGNASVDDMKLANILAFFTNGDAAQCMRIMREASTYRSDKPESYYNHTISKAIDTLTVRPLYGAAQGASAGNKRTAGNGAAQ